jgi:hypothetical protein
MIKNDYEIRSTAQLHITGKNTGHYPAFGKNR